MLDTAEGTLPVSDLGTPADRVALKDWLEGSLALPSADRARLLERETPPRDRDVETRDTETIVMHPSRRARIIGSRITWTLVAIVSLGWIDAARRGAVMTTAESTAVALTVLIAGAAT